MIHAGNVHVQFSAGISHKHVCSTCADQNLERRYFPCNFGFSAYFLLKVLLAKNCCHTTLKQHVPYIWDPDTFSQSDRHSENVIEIEIAPEVSQLQDHSGPGKIISQKHYKNLKCYKKMSHNVLASQSPSQLYFGSFGVI